MLAQRRELQGKMLETIRNYIQEYDGILVLNTGILRNEIIFREISKHSGKKILLLMKKPEMANVSKGNIDIQSISEEQYYNIEKLYYTYEFSDHICLLTDNIQYGSLENYILNGLLTEEEVFAALLQG